MKKLLILLVFVALGGLITMHVNRGDSSTSANQPSQSGEKTMAFSPDLQEALDVMKSLQSMSVQEGDQGAVSEPEIIALGAKVFQISDTFAHNDSRIEVLGADRDHFETVAWDLLASHYPNNIQLKDVIVLAKKPDAFINAYSDYVAELPDLITDKISEERGSLGGIGEAFWKALFEVTKDTREIIARMRGNDWLEKYTSKLCVTNETGGGDQIKFSRGADGSISYERTFSWDVSCQSDRYLNVIACVDNQIEDEWTTVKCPHGCHQGACRELPAPVVELSHFELCKANEVAVDNFVPGESGGYLEFDLGVVATNSDGSTASDYDGKGLIIITGDNDATYPEQTTLTLDGGVGYFPISLTKTQSTFGQPVTLSYKDATYYINGSEAYGDLKVCSGLEEKRKCETLVDVEGENTLYDIKFYEDADSGIKENADFLRIYLQGNVVTGSYEIGGQIYECDSQRDPNIQENTSVCLLGGEETEEGACSNGYAPHTYCENSDDGSYKKVYQFRKCN